MSFAWRLYRFITATRMSTISCSVSASRSMRDGSVNIIGAGLCGSLLSIMFARRGITSSVYERQQDPRCSKPSAGRSINLAMSARGMRALRHAGLLAEVEPLLLPMRGRLIHKENGTTELQPYGQREQEQIYSVSRAGLNRLLVTAACERHGVAMQFGREAVEYAPKGRGLTVRNHDNSNTYTISHSPLIAADGAGSRLRRAFSADSYISPAESLLPHGYKELSIPAGPGGRFRLATGALHVWPRGGFMLIALPNPGGDFTLTLFLPNDGPASFAALDSATSVSRFFEQHFADVMPLIPDLTATFAANPVGILGTVRCRHWHVGGDLLLIGDAAHAVVPFHGQGMNLAFEDCVVLDEILAQSAGDWDSVFRTFEHRQLDNANAIADMALENYVEMRDTVRDPGFLLRKALAFELERRLPGRFIPRYSMVMFHDEIP
ncbi:MAG TPA: NAD(P)/FAD-dependent oxidoreductase, partial [Woeseiaceae bacterium]|nr:NAD(P)/FAD-dependent oxidoreductase [Woeseiaceae bacterium]